jgi:predicted glycosyltransferase
MRDVTFGPEQTRSIWTNEGVYPLLDEAYDRILVYGDRRVFDPIAAYGMSELAASRTRFCGYLAPSPPRRSPTQVRDEVGAGTLPLVAVSVGGGGDGCAFLRTYLAGLRDGSRAPVLSYVVTGPLLPEQDRDEIIAMTDSLPNVRVVDFDRDFAAVVRAADAVVCMGGYNSIVESVYFGKRPIVMPRVPGSEEQVLRAEGFSRLGLATVVGPDPLDVSALWHAIDRELNRAGVPTPTVNFDGLECIARELASLATG